jgi:voltage-gated potassium channel
MSPAEAFHPPVPAGGRWRHSLMVTVSLLFLCLTGVLLPHSDSGDVFREFLRQHPWHRGALGMLWLFVAVEAGLGLFQGSDNWRSRLRRLALVLLLPPLRMVAATGTPDGWLWIPGVGWRRTGAATSEKMEHKLAFPMLLLTLLVIPVLGVELGAGETLESRPRLAMALHLATSLIWIGFTAEFIWMTAATPQKLAYCQRHWIHLVIILLPLAAFLRTLQIVRFGRFLRAGKILRAYRLRTLSARLWRVLTLYDFLDRLRQRNPVAYCDRLERQIAELNDQIQVLQRKLNAFKNKGSIVNKQDHS